MDYETGKYHFAVLVIMAIADILMSLFFAGVVLFILLMVLGLISGLLWLVTIGHLHLYNSIMDHVNPLDGATKLIGLILFAWFIHFLFTTEYYPEDNIMYEMEPPYSRQVLISKINYYRNKQNGTLQEKNNMLRKELKTAKKFRSGTDGDS